MNSRLLLAACFFAAVSVDGALAQSNYTYSIQDTLIGADIVQSSGTTGAGITFGVIDTGIAAPWVGFGGRVDTARSTCMIASCPKSLAISDDNGHGTFVASEIIGNINGGGLVGVAPGGSAFAVKVLNAQATGLVSDVANGIVYAVNRGAQVLNLSMTFVPTSQLISAINYAVSKNAIIVFAGGNNSQPFMNGGTVSGFTDAAIKRMFFMGSTNAQAQLSAFSNTPGTGGFISTSGKFYAFDTRWMMADGENIWGASNYHTAQLGYGYMIQMSGTSMAAPQGAGAAGLLAARWPFLLKNGQIPQILLQTAQDMGTGGVDSTYGAGFLRVDRAFQPVGSLAVPVQGRMVPAGRTQIVASGALGNLSGLSRALSGAVAYDSYNRDFPLSLAASITTKSSAIRSSPVTAQVTGQTGASARSFTELGGGGWLALSFNGEAHAPAWSPDARLNPGLIQDPTRPVLDDWSIGFSQGTTYVGVGQGVNAALSFNDARWGGRTAFFNSEPAGALLALASGANFAAVGIDASPTSRIAVGVLGASDNTFASLTGTGTSAHGAALGYTFRPGRRWTVSFTSGYLDEKNAFLGSPSGGFLALGPSASTMSLGGGVNVELGAGYQLGLDAAYASTAQSNNASSLIGSTSRLSSAAFSLAFSKDDLTGAKDRVGISLDKPLRVYGGTANVVVPVGTDVDGNPVTQVHRVSLVPTGSETDVRLAYDRPLGRSTTAGLSLSYRHDADNVAGASDGAAMIRIKASF